MRHCAVEVFTLILWLGTAPSVSAQAPGWTDPVRIDSTRQTRDVIMAVGPKGEIALVCYGGVFISEDNGRHFELRYIFRPPVSDFWMFVPNGVGFDNNSVLWVSWAWDECDAPGCDFSVARWLFISRSIDGGRTFEHVLQYPRGFLTGVNGPHPSLLFVDAENTVHFVRDSVRFVGFDAYDSLTYVLLPGGDWMNPVEYPLPAFPDSLALGDRFIFHVPPDDRPLVIGTGVLRSSTRYGSYRLFTKQRVDGIFTDWTILGELAYPDFGFMNVVQTGQSQLYLKASMHQTLPTPRDYYLALESNDNGTSFGMPQVISEEAFLVTLADSAGLYGAAYSYPRQKYVYVQLGDLFSAVVDSAFFEGNPEGFRIDEQGGKYVVYTTGNNLSYFTGKDITLGIEGFRQLGDDAVRAEVYPNPFNASTTLAFSASTAGSASIALVDILGRRVREWNDYELMTGRNQLAISGDGLSSGVYFVVVRIGQQLHQIRVLLVK